MPKNKDGPTSRRSTTAGSRETSGEPDRTRTAPSSTCLAAPPSFESPPGRRPACSHRQIGRIRTSDDSHRRHWIAWPRIGVFASSNRSRQPARQGLSVRCLGRRTGWQLHSHIDVDRQARRTAATRARRSRRRVCGGTDWLPHRSVRQRAQPSASVLRCCRSVGT